MSETVAISESPQPSRSRKIFSILGWSAVAVFFLISFTVIKLPQDRIRNLVQSTINSELAPRGASFAFDESSLSIGWGISYVMKGIHLTFPDPDGTFHIERIEVSPSIIPLIFGKMGGSIRIENGDGYLDASFTSKNGLIDSHFKAKSLDLNKLGLLAFAGATGVKASAAVSGDGAVSGDFNKPSSLEGAMNVKLERVILDQQALMGFSIPKIAISEGNAEASLEHGKMTVKSLKLGKSASDDIQATVTGDIVLNQTWDSSNLNLKARFSFSDSVKKAFIILDAILAQGKQADGSFAYQLTGPISAIQAQPLAAGSP